MTVATLTSKGQTTIEIEKKDLAWAALANFKASRADFADCLIGVTNALAGCESTLTFDRSAASLSAFKQV